MSAIQDASDGNNKNGNSNKHKNNNEEHFYNDDVHGANDYENLSNNPSINPTSLIHDHIISFIFETVNIPENSLVWDLGCGTGAYLQQLLNNEKVKIVVGSDTENEAIDYINKNKINNYTNKNKLILHKNNYDNLNWKQENINKYGKINLLFTSFVLHHIKGSNRNKLLNDIYNNLTDNGIFAILEMSPERSQIMMDQVVELKNNNNQNPNDKDNNKHNKHKHHHHHHDEHHDHGNDENKQDDEHGDGGHDHDHDFKSLEDTVKELEEKQFKHIKSFDLSEKSDDWKKTFDQNEDSKKMKKYLEKEKLNGYFLAIFKKNGSK